MKRFFKSLVVVLIRLVVVPLSLVIFIWKIAENEASELYRKFDKR